MIKLTVAALLLFAGFFVLPTNDRIRTTLQIYFEQFPNEWRFYNEDRDPERLTAIYHAENFSIPKTLKQQLGQDDVVIIPPKDHLLRHLSPGQIQWTEPRYFYYVAGPIRTVPWQDAELESVTQAIFFTGKSKSLKLHLMPMDSPEAWERIRARYEAVPEE